MKKVLAFIVLVTIQTMFCAISAQFSTKEALFFCEAGEGVREGDNVQIIIIYSNGTIGHTNNIPRKIRERLNESEYYYDNLKITDAQNGWVYGYNSDLSTSSRVVYMRKHYIDDYPLYQGLPMYGMTPTKKLHRYEYIAISIDKSSIIMWTEKPNNLEGKTSSKRYYSRVQKSEFLPKSVNYDFLNE